MIADAHRTHGNARSRADRGPAAVLALLAPALAVVVLLFGGGLALGLLQGLGHLPAAGLTALNGAHFQRVLTDPDFGESLGLTLFIASVSTTVAAGIAVPTALALNAWAGRSRWVRFLVQVPLTVPHLVVAVAAMFLLSPTGLLSRAAVQLGLIASSERFPLLVNDAWGIGIMATYIWKEIPFIALMLLSVLRGAGTELIEVGATLRAGPWQRFRHITLPIILPSLGAACLIVFAYTFGAFEVPYLLGRTYPMMLPVLAYKNYSDVDLLSRPEGIAAGLVIAAVVSLSVALAQALAQAARRRGVMP